LPGNVFDGKAIFVVRMQGMHGKALCRALPSLSCATPLPCGREAAVRQDFAVRHKSLSCA
jgi:hypothetical protein